MSNLSRLTKSLTVTLTLTVSLSVRVSVTVSVSECHSQSHSTSPLSHSLSVESFLTWLIYFSSSIEWLNLLTQLSWWFLISKQWSIETDIALTFWWKGHTGWWGLGIHTQSHCHLPTRKTVKPWKPASSVQPCLYTARRRTQRGVVLYCHFHGDPGYQYGGLWEDQLAKIELVFTFCWYCSEPWWSKVSMSRFHWLTSVHYNHLKRILLVVRPNVVTQWATD